MTLGDAGTTKMTVVGPQGLGLFMTSTRSYAIRSNLQLDMTEVAAASAEPCFKDDNLSVYAVPIAPHPVQSSLKRKREDDALDEPQKASRITDGSRAHRHGQKMTAEPWRNVSAGLGFMRQGQYNERDIPLYCAPLDLALAYVCVGPLIRGKFDAARAQELGVVGRDRGRLTRGQTVTLANGTVVTPDMCIAPSIPPAVSNTLLVLPKADCAKDLLRRRLPVSLVHRRPRRRAAVCAAPRRRRAARAEHLLPPR